MGFSLWVMGSIAAAIRDLTTLNVLNVELGSVLLPTHLQRLLVFALGSTKAL